MYFCSVHKSLPFCTLPQRKGGKEMKRKERNLMKAAVATTMVVSLAPFKEPNIVLAYDAVQQQNAQKVQNESASSKDTDSSTDSSQLIQKNDEKQAQTEAEKSEEQSQITEKEESPKVEKQQSNEQERVQIAQSQNTISGVSNEETVAKIEGTNYASLKEAVDDAQNGETIIVTKSIYVNEEVKVVNKNITIKGLNNKITLYRADSYLSGYLLNVDASSTVTLENINYDGGAGGFTAGEEVVQNKRGYVPVNLASSDLQAKKSMIYSEGKIVAKNSNFKNAVIVDGEKYGAVLRVKKGSAEFENCNIQHNAVYSRTWACGGAIFADSGEYLKFKDTHINQNYASSAGFSYNFGGAVYSSTTTMEFTGGTINDNSASENGGAIYANSPVKKVTMQNVDLYRNSSGNDGGAVHLMSADGDFINCKFIDNRGMAQTNTSLGMICYAYGTGKGNIINCTFKGNREEAGSAVANFGNTFELNIDGCHFEENHQGTVVWLHNAKLSLKNSTFTGNEDYSLELLGNISEKEYKDEYAKYLTAQVENCKFLGNKSSDMVFTVWNTGDKPYTVNVKNSSVDGQNVESNRRSIFAGSGTRLTLDNVEVKNKKVNGYHGVGIGASGTDTVVNLTNGSTIHGNSGNGSAGIAAWGGAYIDVDETSKVYDNNSSSASDDIYLNGKESQISFYKDSVIGEKLSSSCGHTIDGWYIDEKDNKYNEKTGNIVQIQNDSKQIVLKDKDSYGLKAAHSIYSITYNANYGDNKEIKSSSLAPGSKVKLPSTLFERDKYEFTGWNTKADGTGKAYRYDAKTGKYLDENEIEIPTHDVTLYAQWAFKMVKVNAAPTIKAEDKVINIGDEFNPLKDVFATDKEDGDITTKVKVVKNDVDTSKSGTYNVTYEVTDNDGATTTKTIQVTVKENITITPSKDNDNKGNTTHPGQSSGNNNNKKNVSSPKTGDATQTGLFALLLSFSGMLLGLLKRKKEN